jgi:hypothetical protein
VKIRFNASLPFLFCAPVAAFLFGCGPGSQTIALAPAPPGPADLGPAAGLSTPPSNAVIFDLKYVAQTGGTGDIQYFSFWGYGGSDDEAQRNPFLQAVGQKTPRLYYVQNPSFTGRKWAAIEYHRRVATALYFDLNADGKLSEEERILPTRRNDSGVDFITPDFLVTPQPGGPAMLCRALLRVNFYQGSSEPNCMWSPAAVLEGSAELNGKPARLLLYASSPAGEYAKYGASGYALLTEDQANSNPDHYISRETLSSLVCIQGSFYHLTIDGLRSNGLPARVLLAKDDSPTGELSVKLTGSNSFPSTFASLYLNGVNDKNVFLRVSGVNDKLALPTGTYTLSSGTISYGSTNANEWDVSFTKGPSAMVEAGQSILLALGEPTLAVRAIDLKDRYNSQAVESATFKRGTTVYLEPKILGKGQEVFGRFRETTGARNGPTDRPPRITITGPDGKNLLSKVMDYG